MAMKYGLISTVAASVAAGAMAAQWTGAGSTTEWSNPDNWEKGTVGSADVRIEAAKVTGSKIITFDAPYTFTDIFHVYAGTAEDPVIFRATGENGLAAVNNKEMYVGAGASNPGYLILDGGTYLFKNDLKLGYKGANATLVVKDGTIVRTPHWLRISEGGNDGTGTANFVVEGGEVTVGYRDGAEVNNAILTFGDANDTKSTFKMSGGRLRSQDNGGKTPEAAFQYGRGARSSVTGEITGGTIASLGAVKIGQGAGSKVDLTMKGGTWNATADFRVASETGGNITGTFTNDGGELTVGANFCVGTEASDTGTFVQKSGTVNTKGITYIGRRGTGVFEMTGGTYTSGGNVFFSTLGGPFTGTMTGGTLTGSQVILCDGSGGNSATFVQDGGEVIAKSWFVVGRGEGSTSYTATYTLENGIVRNTGDKVVIGAFGKPGDSAKLVMNGGELYGANDLWIGENASGEFELNGGVADFSKGWVRISKASSDAEETHILSLNGGTLKTNRLLYEVGSGPAVVNFNGGVLQFAETRDDVFPRNDNLTLKVGANGAKLDTNGKRITIASDFTSSVEEGTDGGLTVLGGGHLVLAGALTYTGVTDVQNGVLGFVAGKDFTGGVNLGEHGAITVNLAEVPAEEILEGAKIKLFSTPALTFSAADDSLATTVFLIGPVVGYTLSYEDGTVYATLTDVSKASLSRKVTVCVTADGFIDQNGSFSNGMPNNDSYDVVIFPQDAILRIWGNNKSPWEVRNRRMGDLVVRHSTMNAHWNNAQYPNLDALHLAGVGTVRLTRIGLRLDDPNTDKAIAVDAGVAVEAWNVGTDHGQDNWIGGDAELESIVTINGDLVATNGVLRILDGCVINGRIICGSYDIAAHLFDDAAAQNDSVTINGEILLLEGGTFDFRNRIFTVGENAKITYAGGKAINLNGKTFPNVEVADGVNVYGDLAAIGVETEVTVTGGTLRVPSTLAEGFQPVVLGSGAAVQIDGESVGEVAEGTKVTLPSVVFADGVTLDDVTVSFVNSTFDWNVHLTEEGALEATAYTATSANKWVGGASGLYNVKGNWTHGIPTIDQTVEFDNDAVVYHNYKGDVFLEIGKLVLKGHRVSFEILNHDKQYWGAVRIGSFDEHETGTLGLWRTGVWTRKGGEGNVQRLDWPATMKLEVGGTEIDCWLRDDWGDQYVRCPVEILESTTTLNLDKNVHLLGGVSGPGYVTARQEAVRNGNCRLIGGDWSAFTGTYTGHREDRTRFATDFTGSAKAHWNFPQYIRLDAMEGTVTFGSIESTNDRRIEVQKDSTLVLEVGGRNTDFTIAPGVYFYENTASDWSGTWTQGTSTVKIRKVGTGTLTENLVAAAKLEVAKGTAVINAPNENLALTVKAEATVYAGAEGAKVGSATFETGAQVLLTSAEAADVHALAVATETDVTGVKVVLGTGVEDALLAQEEGDPTAYTLLTAPMMTGAPNGDVVVTCSDEGFGWKAQVRENSLQLRRKYIKPGLIIIVM